MSDFFADSAAAGEGGFTVSDSAVKRIAFLIEQEEGDDLFLRVSVSGGGNAVRIGVIPFIPSAKRM